MTVQSLTFTLWVTYILLYTLSFLHAFYLFIFMVSKKMAIIISLQCILILASAIFISFLWFYISNLTRELSSKDNYSLHLLPNDMRLADDISEYHVTYFSDPENVKMFSGCRKEVISFLRDYTIGSYSDFLECQSKFNIGTSSTRREIVNRLEALYQ